MHVLEPGAEISTQDGELDYLFGKVENGSGSNAAISSLFHSTGFADLGQTSQLISPSHSIHAGELLLPAYEASLLCVCVDEQERKSVCV